MTLSRDLFNERTQEINLYFAFLDDIINKKASLIFPVPHGLPPEVEREEKQIPLDLWHTLKANGFLLLYNLIEATIVNAIEEIHDQIDSENGIDVDSLVETLTERAMKRFRGSGEVEYSMLCKSPISQGMLRHWLDEHERKVAANEHPLFSGNVDARKIREVAALYGFCIQTDEAKTKNGANLLTVKTKRNNLAHGQVPFRDCGREVSLPELVDIKTEVVLYLDDVLDAVEDYLAHQSYLRRA